MTCLLLGGGLFVLCAVPLGRRAEVPAPQSWNGRAVFHAEGTGPLLAGAAKVKLPVPPGAPLAGYATPFGRSWDGEGEPLYARAVVIEAGGLRISLLALDLLLIPAGLEAEIFRRASLPAQACALIAATHTHSGVGGTWDSAIGAALGNGRFDPASSGAIAQAGADAIMQAAGALGPVGVTAAQTAFDRGPARPRSGDAIDPTLTTIRFDGGREGRPIATVAIYGMHPTVLGRKSRRLSGEWPAAAARALEWAGGVGLVFQGAGGNATWTRSGEAEPTAIQRLGEEVAAAAILAQATRPLPTLNGTAGAQTLTCETRLVPLPPAQASPAVPWLLRRAASNLLSLAHLEVVPQVTIGLGPLTLLGVPGEPVGPLGVSARARAKGPLAVIGLADGYVGYIETAAQAGQTGGETARTNFGPSLAARLGLERPQAAP